MPIRGSQLSLITHTPYILIFYCILISPHRLQSIDAGYYFRCLYVYVLVTTVIPAKTAAPVKMLPFHVRSQVGRRNHVLVGGPHYEWTIKQPKPHSKFQQYNSCEMEIFTTDTETLFLKILTIDLGLYLWKIWPNVKLVFWDYIRHWRRRLRADLL